MGWAGAQAPRMACLCYSLCLWAGK